MCVLLEQALATLSVYVCPGLCEHALGLRVLAQANLSKQVFVIASGRMTFGASLESPVTSCGGDRGQEGKELTKEAGKTLAR